MLVYLEFDVSDVYLEAVTENVNAYFDGLCTLQEFISRCLQIALAYPVSQAVVDRTVGRPDPLHFVFM